MDICQNCGLIEHRRSADRCRRCGFYDVEHWPDPPPPVTGPPGGATGLLDVPGYNVPTPDPSVEAYRARYDKGNRMPSIGRPFGEGNRVPGGFYILAAALDGRAIDAVYGWRREKDVSQSNNNGDHSEDPLRAKAEDPQVLWEEYEYRHSLVWKVIIQITTAAVVLSVVPYVANKTIVERLEWWILSAPALAFVLALFAVLVTNSELDILDTIRREHRNQQRAILRMCYDTDRGFFQSMHFRWFVNAYLLVLSMLSLANSVICAIWWVPSIALPS